MSELADSDALGEVAADATARLTRALESLR
jgi:hypothetical protein